MNTTDYMAYTADNYLPASKFSVFSNLSSPVLGLYTVFPSSVPTGFLVPRASLTLRFP